MSILSRRTRWLAFFLFWFALSLGSWAQKTNEKTPPPPDQHTDSEPEHHITPDEAAQLFRDLDNILKEDSQSTGLPLKHNIKHRLTSRDEVTKFLSDRFRE